MHALNHHAAVVRKAGQNGQGDFRIKTVSGIDLGHVFVAFGKAARVACGGDGDYAFEAAIVGIVDDVERADASKTGSPD